MAKKVFAVYLAKEGNPNSDAYAKLDLPASPWELWDALDKVRLQTDDILYIVPSNFRQVEAPRVDCKVLSKLTGGTQFVNTSDAGGVYNGQWIMATSRWVTRVYAPSKPLPRTGY